MVKVAKNQYDLKKRLLRFFEKNDRLKTGLSEFLDPLSEQGDVLLFGGAIRDIALNGIRHFNSDLDFVFVGDSMVLSQGLSSIGHVSNRKLSLAANKFGGWRLQTEQLLLDIWPIQETWAFKQSWVDYQSIGSLLNTTITNWDAILFSWRHKKLYFGSDYFTHLETGYLDLVLDKNPNELGLLVRILRHFVLKEANIFSPRLGRVVYEKMQKYSFSQIAQHEQMSYCESYITPTLLLYLDEQLPAAIEQNQAIVLEKFNHTIPLFP